MPQPAADTATPLLSSLSGPGDLRSLSIDQLRELAGEIRAAICDQVSESGGHLAPNLGVVELTLALHRMFDFGPYPDGDRLLFDVGHQCYPHKLLTGRLPLLPQLRKRGGMAGFPDPEESPHDLFAVGHAGTAISTAVGMARGDDVIAGGPGKSDRKVVALVGDASIVNGVALEGLNNAGTLKRQFLVVLNDNGMSIGKPQGGISSYFDRVRVSHTYSGLKRRVRQAIENLPGGGVIHEMYHRSSEMLKAAINSGHMFEGFGLICVGPIDGHDLPWLIDMLEEVRDINRPVLLHVKTVKGKGYDFSEGDATAFHSPKPFKVEGCRVRVSQSGRSFSSAFADMMGEILEADDRAVAVTAAMPDGTSLVDVMGRFPERTFDTGICESHAMDMCAGMAKAGLKPFFVVYSTFVQRALDQLFQEVALQGLPVRVCLDRGGFVGGDGAVHHGFMDVPMLRALPGVVLMAACDEPNLRGAMRFMHGYEDGATVVRYPRDTVPVHPLQGGDNMPEWELGKANLVVPSEGEVPDVAVLGYGTMVYTAVEALEDLRRQGYDVAVYDARFASPVDADLIESLLRAGVRIVTIEDGALAGGFGSSVLEAANERGLSTAGIRRLGMPPKWIKQGSRSAQLAEAGLDAAAVARAVREVMDVGGAGDVGERDAAIVAEPAPDEVAAR